MANDTSSETKSDVMAKEAFVRKLESKGCYAEIISQPVDIHAIIDGEDWFFEIKMTRKDNKIFGAATLTEWEKAFEVPERFRFVVAKEENNGEYSYKCFTPEEFMEFSVIPPPKIYFNIKCKDNNYIKTQRREETVLFTKQRYELMSKLFMIMKKLQMNTIRMGTIDGIVNRWLDITISQRGSEGETRFFLVHNEQLGEILVTNCHLKSDPQYDSNAQNYLIGSVELILSDCSEVASFVAELNIYPFDNSKGQLMFKR